MPERLLVGRVERTLPEEVAGRLYVPVVFLKAWAPLLRSAVVCCRQASLRWIVLGLA